MEGQEVWVGPLDGDNPYQWAEITEVNVKACTANVTFRNQTTGTVAVKECFLTNPKPVADLCAMHNINEATILSNLEERADFTQTHPYTYLNTVLVAVNPLRVLPDQPSFEDYTDVEFDSERPHPYAISELAYKNLRMPGGGSQSIVISGESGAGKTETAKIVLLYLSNRSSADDVVQDMGDRARVSQCIRDSTPIFEEFGNAKTLRNNNSSRFGKFIRLQFDSSLGYTLVGAYVTTYLLEKTRVCFQAAGERNYHIFFDLLCQQDSLDGELCLASPEDYFYLSQSGNTDFGGDESEMFTTVESAMGIIGVDSSRQLEVWKLIAGILHLGNSRISESDTDEGLKAVVKDMKSVALAAHMFGVETEHLHEVLTIKRITTEGTTIAIKLHKEEAVNQRDAVSKAVYERAFLWLVKMTNDHLGFNGDMDYPFIGVLDIFGFESFAVNGIEQVLINYANESLQCLFNKQVFEEELRLFEEENIVCAGLKDACPDNKPCVDLLADRSGVLGLLNEQSQQIQPSENKLVRDLHKAHKGNRYFPPVAKRDEAFCFAIQHFAGPVVYTVAGWIDKNMDTIPETMFDLFMSSSASLVRAIFTTSSALELSSRKGDKKADRRKSVVNQKKRTVSSSFVRSMHDLTSLLSSTQCNFIRCIKPNAPMKPGLFERRYVTDQLRCLGILATCEVLKAGMPTRVTYKELLKALENLPASTRALFVEEPEIVWIAASLFAFEVPADSYQLGRTRVFFKAGEMSRVERMLRTNMAGEAGQDIAKRMVQALEMRHQALEAVRQLDAAIERVDQQSATMLLDEVNDACMQVSRDHAAAESCTTSALSAAGITRAKVRDCAGDLAKCKADLTVAAALSEDPTLQDSIDSAFIMLRQGENASERATSQGLGELRKSYAALQGEAASFVAELRSVVGDIQNDLSRIQQLHREAQDGANRCLLNYTVERTTVAIEMCTTVVSLIEGVERNGATAATGQEFVSRGNELTMKIQTAIAATNAANQDAASAIVVVKDSLAAVRAVARKAASAAAAAARQENLSGGSHRSGAGGGGGEGCGELQAMVGQLQAKLQSLETRHNDQLKAVVTKIQQLQGVIREQQKVIGSMAPTNPAQAQTAMNTTLQQQSLLSLNAMEPLAAGEMTEEAEEAEALMVASEAGGEIKTPENKETGLQEERRVAEEANLDDRVHRHGSALAGLNQQHIAELEKLMQPHEQALADQRSDGEVERFARKLEQMRGEHMPELATTKASHDGRIQVLEQQLEEQHHSRVSGKLEQEDAALEILRDELDFDDLAKPGPAIVTGTNIMGPSAEEVLMLREELSLVTRRLDDLVASGTRTAPGEEGDSGTGEAGGSPQPSEGTDDGDEEEATISAAVESRMQELERQVKQLSDRQSRAFIRSVPTSPDIVGRPRGRGAVIAAAADSSKRTPVQTPTREKVSTEGISSSRSAGRVQASRASLWESLKHTVFGTSASDVTTLTLKVLDVRLNGKHDGETFSCEDDGTFIEVCNITTSQTETTRTLQDAINPAFEETFFFKTKTNTKDMIMMKIMQRTGGENVSTFGSVALPLDDGHTQGNRLVLPIFDEALNMKGVVRVAAAWVTAGEEVAATPPTPSPSPILSLPVTTGGV